MKKIILYAGSFINLLLAIFHMFFWKILNWSEELPKLSVNNQAVLQVANIIIIFIILYFAVMSFIMARLGKLDLYAKSIIISIAGFYSIRIITGYPFFGFNYEELVIWIICFFIVFAYLSILFIKNKVS